MALSNAEYVETLKTQRDAYFAELALLGPSFSVDGVSVSSERAELLAAIKDIETLIDKYQGPVVAYSVGD
jgi:hypothetical protein